MDEANSSNNWANLIKNMMSNLENKLTENSLESSSGDDDAEESTASTQDTDFVDIPKIDEFVLPDPPLCHQAEYNSQHCTITPVIVDPHIAKHLRPHQRQGVEFLYKAVYLNVKSYTKGGAILADDMGVGKTLQCIALLWTLYKQDPYQGVGVVKKAIIVCPSSLVDQWKREFQHWLGSERIRVFAVNSSNTIEKWNAEISVLIISYEMAVRSAFTLRAKQFDLMICDEAHKIKNSKLHSYQLLKSINCSRRIMLTGTPVSNDLMELFTLADFVQPRVLGSEKEFKKKFADPIAKYQKDGNSTYMSSVGIGLASLLNAKMSSFFLRRDSSIMLNYLPLRVTSIVFCKASPLQVKLYTAVKHCKAIMSCANGNSGQASQFAILSLLKKLCNHPSLVHPAENQQSSIAEIYSELGKQFPDKERHPVVEADSGKLAVLVHMLDKFGNQGSKVVLVSHYTTTLDLLERVCKNRGFRTLRLDGSTLQTERAGIVDKFNNSNVAFIFLMSSKAGGVGLNLQSASKIILYDIDWNPAHDIQAMARCWRPGQRQETHIYRLITCGTIEERIYQRQIGKQNVSGSVIDLLLTSNTKFSAADLKDIFTFYENGCLTHNSLRCKCTGDGSNGSQPQDEKNDENEPPAKRRKTEHTVELLRWEHFKQPLDRCDDIDSALVHPAVEIIFRNKFSSFVNEGAGVPLQ